MTRSRPRRPALVDLVDRRVRIRWMRAPGTPGRSRPPSRAPPVDALRRESSGMAGPALAGGGGFAGILGRARLDRQFQVH